MSNFIIKFWYGKVPLWKSYWIIGELINALVVLLIYNIEIRLLDNTILYQQIPFFNFNSLNIITKISLFAWTIFITVGIWRSAEAYRGRFIWIVLALIFLSYRVFALRMMF